MSCKEHGKDYHFSCLDCEMSSDTALELSWHEIEAKLDRVRCKLGDAIESLEAVDRAVESLEEVIEAARRGEPVDWAELDDGEAADD